MEALAMLAAQWGAYVTMTALHGSFDANGAAVRGFSSSLDEAADDALRMLRMEHSRRVSAGR